jgi:hypothetical protein
VSQQVVCCRAGKLEQRISLAPFHHYTSSALGRVLAHPQAQVQWHTPQLLRVTATEGCLRQVPQLVLMHVYDLG